MKVIYFLSIIILMLLTNCGVSNIEDKEKFKPVFKAEFNGEPFDGTGFEESAKAGMSSLDGEHIYFNIFAYQYNEQKLPYNEYIGVSLVYEEGEKIYSTQKDTVKINETYSKYPGGKYSEKDGDARISWYEAFDENGYISVEMDTLKNGEIVVFGTFQMKVAVESRTDQYSQRVGQDTLHITNGEYRLLLNDRRIP